MIFWGHVLLDEKNPIEMLVHQANYEDLLQHANNDSYYEIILYILDSLKNL